MTTLSMVSRTRRLRTVALGLIALGVTAATPAWADLLTGDPSVDADWTFRGNSLQTQNPIYLRHTDGPGQSPLPPALQDYDVYTRIFRLTNQLPTDAVFQTNDTIIGLGFVLNNVAPNDDIAWSEGFFKLDFGNNSFTPAAPGSRPTIYPEEVAAITEDPGDVIAFVDANPNPGDENGQFEVERWSVVDQSQELFEPYPRSSPQIPARILVQTDVEPNIGASRLGMTTGQFLVNLSAINRARGTFEGPQVGVLGDQLTLMLGFLENFGAGLDTVVTMPTSLPPLTNADFSEGLSSWSVATGGLAFAEVVELEDGDSAAALNTGSPVALSQNFDTPGGWFDIFFDYQFLTDTGELSVYFDGELLDTLDAVVMSDFETHQIRVTDPAFFSRYGALTIELDGIANSRMLLDDVSFASVPEPGAIGLLLIGAGLLGGCRPHRRTRLATAHA